MNFAPSQSKIERPSQIEKGEYYCLKNDSSANEALIIIGGGRELCKDEYRLERNASPYYTIEYIASGSCLFKKDGIEQQLGAGAIFAYSPHSKLNLVNNGDTPLIKYFVNFHGPNAEAIIANPMLSAKAEKNQGRLSWIDSTFVSLQECGVSGLRNCHSACSHLLQYLAARLEESCIPRKDSQNMTPSLVSFENIRCYIEANFANINSPQQVAVSCNVSHQYLCRLFKRFTDETPTQMITRLKLLKSADLLKSRTLLVKQVAEKVGFDDQYYFSKCFKEFYGLSPRNFLKVDLARIPA